jgi:hypothetical protein
MSHEHMDRWRQLLSGGGTRRGVLGTVVGFAGLSLGEAVAKPQRRNAKQRKPRQHARQGGKDKPSGPSEECKPSELTFQGADVGGCPDGTLTSIALLHGDYQGYWWDHKDITVAVQAHPNADQSYIAAAREAIEFWNDVLTGDVSDLGVSLTDVTDEVNSPKQADITLHYVPRAGGVVFDGYTLCGKQTCNNVLIASDAPQDDPSCPNYLGWVTLHELGHALGLGHAKPLRGSNDLMAYGWHDNPPPVISDCDLAGLRAVFANFPDPPTDTEDVSCSCRTKTG